MRRAALPSRRRGERTGARRVGDSPLVRAVIFSAMDNDLLPIGSELPPERRGPSALATFGSFFALVAVAVVLITGLVSLARLLEQAV